MKWARAGPGPDPVLDMLLLGSHGLRWPGSRVPILIAAVAAVAECSFSPRTAETELRRGRSNHGGSLYLNPHFLTAAIRSVPAAELG